MIIIIIITINVYNKYTFNAIHNNGISLMRLALNSVALTCHFQLKFQMTFVHYTSSLTICGCNILNVQRNYFKYIFVDAFSMKKGFAMRSIALSKKRRKKLHEIGSMEHNTEISFFNKTLSSVSFLTVLYVVFCFVFVYAFCLLFVNLCGNFHPLFIPIFHKGFWCLASVFYLIAIIDIILPFSCGVNIYE